ncbi:unnamed protein product [Allacma fusca]|uniref:DNA-directed DNA polymerase n=1 Tax=Allacma fusca TaxID=39272 RepID=A0A8J2KWD4_9HEXA|nr:unnamed protein product [Allacma fusca]
MEIENDLEDDVSEDENKDHFLNGDRQNNLNVTCDIATSESGSTSETVSELFSDKSEDLFENSGPLLDGDGHNRSCVPSDIDELGPTQKDNVEDDICFMDISLSSFHLSDSAPEENRKLPTKDSEPLFSSSGSAVFENSDHSPCTESRCPKTLIAVRSVDSNSSSSDLFENDMEPDQLGAALISHGRTIKLQNMYSLEALPVQLFVTEKPVSVGIRIKLPKKSKVKKGGIGARVMGRDSMRSNEDVTCQFSLALYNGGDTIWICEWTSENPFVPYTVAKLESVFHRLAEVSCPVIMIDAKIKIKNLVKNFGPRIIQSMSLLDCIWDPKIAEWLCQGEEVDIEDGENIWICLPKLIDLYLDDDDKKVEDMLWPSEAKECYMASVFMTQLKGKLESCMLWTHFKEIEMACLFPIVLMEINGFAFDAGEFERLKQVLKMQAALLELKAFHIVGRHFNFSSSKDVHRVLFKDLKLCPPRKTRGTGKEVLSKLNHIVASIILEWRKVHHALQLVLPFSQAQNPKTGRIHGAYSHFTVTGRIIMAEPSIQFIPRDFDIKITFSKAEIDSLRSNVRIIGPKITSLLTVVEDGLRLEGENFIKKSTLSIENLASVSMRNAFCTSSNEYVLIAADYSQLELRVLALLSKDANLTGTLNSGCDVFKSIASTWKKIPAAEVGIDLRQEAKAIVYAIIYGMGKTSLGQKMNVSEDKAAGYIENFMKTYPGVRKFIHTTKQVCREKGYVETLLGRRRYLCNINSSESSLRAQAERQAVNYRVQGSASELVKKSMIRVQMRMDLLMKSKSLTLSRLPISTTPRRVQIASGTPETLPCGLVLNLHDELIFEVRKDVLNDVVIIIRESMEKPFSIPVLLPVNIKVGRSWGTLIPYENYASVSLI